MNFASFDQMRHRKYIKPTKLTPKLIKKKIHGQMVWVKVYPPRWEKEDSALTTRSANDKRTA